MTSRPTSPSTKPGAALAKQGGAVAVGSDAIRAERAPLLAVPGALRAQTAKVVATAEIALLRSRGALSGVAPDGPVTVPEHDANEVVRRQPDGTWLVVANDPRGVGA